MRYTIHIKRSAEKEMDRLPTRVFERITEAILELEVEPRPKGAKKVRGTEHYRIRVGAYRVLFTVDDAQRLVEVIAVGHRRDIYRP